MEPHFPFPTVAAERYYIGESSGHGIAKRFLMDFIANSLIVFLGFGVQVQNSINAFRGLHQNCSLFELLYIISMVAYSISFLPMVISTSIMPTAEDSRNSFVAKESLMFNLALMREILLGFSAFAYLGCAQIRFAQLRQIFKYPPILNSALFLISLLVYVLFSLVIYIILPFSGNMNSHNIQSKYGGVWIAYVTGFSIILVIFCLFQIGSRLGAIVPQGQNLQDLITTSMSIIISTSLLIGAWFWKSKISSQVRLSYLLTNVCFSIGAILYFQYSRWLLSIKMLIQLENEAQSDGKPLVQFERNAIDNGASNNAIKDANIKYKLSSIRDSVYGI